MLQVKKSNDLKLLNQLIGESALQILDTDVLMFIQVLINKNIIPIINKNIKSVYEA